VENQVEKSMQAAITDLEIRRVRHPLKIRTLQVAAVTMLTPHMVRLTLAGDELADLHSDGFDDHVKLMLPAAGSGALVLPVVDADGRPDWEASGRPPPVMRDYTPRRIDRDARELDIDFTLHGVGPAARWAAGARPGDVVHVGGPRGSLVVPADLEWQWLIGDESALPAIARRLEELGDEVAVTVLVDCATDDALPALRLGPRRTLVRVPRPSGAGDAGLAAPLAAAVRGLPTPAGRGHVFAAAESQAARAVREVLVAHHGLGKHQIRAAAYWRRGASAVHENLDPAT
jgi:NADPH-dependent ferric siderophore reductase